MADQQQVTIDGVEYNHADLSNAAKLQLSHLRIADQELARLKQQLAMTQTARSAYVVALMAELPEQVKH